MTVWKYLLERLCLAIERPWKKDVGSKILRPGSLEGSLLSEEHFSVFAEEEEPAYVAAEQPTGEVIVTDLMLKLEAMTCAAQTKDVTIAYLEKKLQANLEEGFSEHQKMKVLAEQNFQLQKQLAASHARQHNLEKQIEHMSKTQVILEEAEERLCTQLAESEAEWLEEFRNFKNELVSVHGVLRQKEAEISSLTTEINGFRDVNSTSNQIEKNLALQIAESTQERQVLQSKYSEALSSLEVARSEITKGRTSMDALKREMQRLESSRQMQIQLLEEAQKERDTLQAQMHPIKLEAGGMVFKFITPRALQLAGHHPPVSAS